MLRERLLQTSEKIMNEQTLTFTGRLRSIRCALRGILVVLTTQRNAWLHALATVIVIAAGVAVHLSPGEWCWIVLAIVSVWTAEALNTAFEFLTDVASPGFHPIAANAKDVAAGAVLLAACGAVIIGLLVFAPHILSRFS
jgi:diacylglycerol kinase (ATP)